MPKSSSSWAHWAKLNLLHNKPIWDVNIPSNASWTWRKLLNLRDIIRPHLQHTIGNGRDTFLWFDYWLPSGPIHSQYGDRVIYDSGLQRYARVSSIIYEEHWQWPVANSPYLIILKNSIPDSMNPKCNITDDITWQSSPSGGFTLNSAYSSITTARAEVGWHQFVWFPKAIPKVAFILWLAIKNRLGTQDRLHIASSHPKCLLCNTVGNT